MIYICMYNDDYMFGYGGFLKWGVRQIIQFIRLDISIETDGVGEPPF